MKNLQNYRAAISLNNTAVTLLERQRYRAALDTFRDSMSLIKGVFASGLEGEETTKPETSEADQLLVSRYLTQASRRLSDPCEREEDEEDEIYDEPYFTSPMPPFHLHVLSEESMHPTHVNRAAVFSHRVEFALRMVDIVEQNSSCGEQDLQEMVNLDLDIATILFNCGIAHKCCLAFMDFGDDQFSREHSVKLLEGSANFLEWAQTILRRELNRFFSSSLGNLNIHDLTAANRTVLLSICASKSLTGLHALSHTTQYHASHVTWLYDLFLELQNKLPNYFHLHKSGAAAA